VGSRLDIRLSVIGMSFVHPFVRILSERTVSDRMVTEERSPAQPSPLTSEASRVGNPQLMGSRHVPHGL